MMKRLSVIPLLLVLFSFQAKASHITGGEMYYTYIGMNGNMYEYEVTLRLLQRCGSGRQFLNPTIFSVFDKTTNARMQDIVVPIFRTENIAIGNPDPCITNPPLVCYDVAYYIFNVSLPASPAG